MPCARSFYIQPLLSHTDTNHLSTSTVTIIPQILPTVLILSLPQSSFLPSEIKRQRQTKILFFVLDEISGRKLTQAVTGRGENKKKHVQSNPLSVRKTFRPNSHDLVSPRSTAQVREFEIDGADGTLDRKPLSCAVRSYDRFA